MKKLFITLLLIVSPLFAQSGNELTRTLSGYTNPDEIVTLSESLTFDQAIGILNKISERTTGKKIVSTVSISTPISVPINRMHYRQAVDVLVGMANLEYIEAEDLITIKRPTDVVAEPKSEDVYASVNSREVKISAVFFEADVNEMRERGINWKWLLQSKEYGFGGELKNFIEQKEDENQNSSSSGTQRGEETDFKLSASSLFDLGDFAGEATALFKFFETENLGELIASPSITVRNAQKGRIQIGSDFSIKQRDFSGNIIDRFFSTGSIIEVTPYIYTEEEVDYVMLNLLVDRSSAIPSEISTEVKRTQATTQVLMLNGEETVIGGLFVNEETMERTGIPFLKDLPWWVFGIRYLTGSDQKVSRKKEVVILIKMEILPSLKERMLMTSDKSELHKTLEKYKENIKKYKTNRTLGEK